MVEEGAAAGAGDGQEEASRQPRLAGIFTERDVMRKVIDVPGMLERPVDEVMTTDSSYNWPGRVGGGRIAPDGEESFSQSADC